MSMNSNPPPLKGPFTLAKGWEKPTKDSKTDFLRFVMCPLLAPILIGFFLCVFAVAINSTNEANKVGSTCS